MELLTDQKVLKRGVPSPPADLLKKFEMYQ
jgi:hypothetical protein